MIRTSILAVICLLAMLSCDTVKDKTKKSINKSGEVVGKTAGEFFEGVSEGVERTLDCEVVFSDTLTKLGLESGKMTVKSKDGGDDNMIVLYLIFNKDFNDTLLFKAHDKTGLEIGRTAMAIQGKKGNATYYDVQFDKRTQIEVKSRINVDLLP